MHNNLKVIYLTGQPAVGKTTLVTMIKKICPKVVVFKYSELLAKFVANKMSRKVNQRYLRTFSGKIVTPEDINLVDKRLIRKVRRIRKSKNVIIDSHAVSKEEYGFRITAFSIQTLKALNPTSICMLYADSGTIIKRMAKKPMGRPIMSPGEVELHFLLQANAAITYGTELGVPMYFFDVTKTSSLAFKKISSWF